VGYVVGEAELEVSALTAETGQSVSRLHGFLQRVAVGQRDLPMTNTNGRKMIQGCTSTGQYSRGQPYRASEYNAREEVCAACSPRCWEMSRVGFLDDTL